MVDRSMPTRERLVVAMGELLRRQGYGATSVKQLTEAAGAPMGSLYHHFPGGKPEVAAAALRSSGAAYLALLPTLLDGAPDLDDADVLAVADLALELGQPSRVVGGRTGTDPAVDLGLTDPVPQRLGMNPELIGDPLDRPTRRLRILPGVHRHPRGPLLELNAVLPRCCHASHHPSQD